MDDAFRQATCSEGVTPGNKLSTDLKVYVDKQYTYHSSFNHAQIYGCLCAVQMCVRPPSR